MKRHINNHRHSNLDHFSPFNGMPYSTEKCQQFQFEHPFACMVAGMTGSGRQDCLGPIAVNTSIQND